MAQNTEPQSLRTAVEAASTRIGRPLGARPVDLNTVRKPDDTPEIDFGSETETALRNLETAVETYQASEGQPNTDLLDARAEVNRLLAELNAAQTTLALEEQKGSLLDRLNASVLVAERHVESLRNHYQRLVTDQILKQRFGQSVPVRAVSSDTKRELRLHARLTNLQRFHIPGRTLHEQITPEFVYARAEKAATTLDALNRHIAQDQAGNVKNNA
jgi:hypothetical protein